MKLNLFILTNIILIFTLVIISACSSDNEDHGETPVGLILTSNGNEIAMQEESTVTYVEGNSIVVPENGQITVEVQFIAEDGDRYTPDVNDGFSLVVNTGNNQILDVTHPFNNNEWTLALIGQTSDSTSITFDLLHAGHSDFETQPFQITVTEN